MNCRGDDDIDAKRSRPSIGKTRDGPREERTRAFVWDPISGLHQGQQPKRLHSKAEYMAAPERFAELSDFSLAPRAPSIHEAICEAVRRPTMRFVQIKSVEQQGQLMQHRARDLLMRQRTQVINAMRAHLAELGIVAAQGREGILELLEIV